MAVVDGNGSVTAVSPGSTTITGTIDGAAYACEITVKEPKINKKSLTLKTSKTGTVKLTNTKLKASEVEWKSSDENVVEILENGKVRAVAPGKATVSTAIGRYVYGCEVTVK